MASQPQRLKHCLNCQRGLPNLEAYCPDCGQKNINQFLSGPAQLRNI